MKKIHYAAEVLVRRLAVLLFASLFLTNAADAQSQDGVWRRTIVVATLDGTTMEYLIDQDTKVKVEKPNLIIETEGVVLYYDLDMMLQVRYGKRFVQSGVEPIIVDDNQPFKWEDETLFFFHLPEETLIEVFTTDGKQVVSRRCSGDAQLPLRSLHDGVYLVKLNQTTYKILKR